MKRNRGFTMIEVMIVVVIVAILAAIALPSYQRHVTESRRTAAQACLLELAQFMERHYTTRMTYAGAVLPQTQCLVCGFEENADVVGAINILARGHRVAACGEDVKPPKAVRPRKAASAKQEPAEVTIREVTRV